LSKEKRYYYLFCGIDFQGATIMPSVVKKKQEREIARCGNSAVLYLPKGYFIPGETVNLNLEIDFDGKLKLTLKKNLFKFNCDKLKKELTKTFTIRCDKTEQGTRTVSAVKGNLSVDCTCSTQELEPAYVNVSRLFQGINSSEAFTSLTSFVEKLAQKYPGVFVEPEGDIDAVKVFKDPKKFSLENEVQAVDFLRKKGKRLNYAVVLRFNSKKDSFNDVMHVIEQLSRAM
jgi:hypothetical protein